MRRCRPLLGTFVEIDCEKADAIDQAFQAIERVHRLMSAHEPESELSRINRDAHRRPIDVSAETGDVLRRALHWSRLSGGLFDVVRAGARALEQGRIPRHAGQPVPETIDSASVVVQRRSVQLTAPACLDLGGIAKGFAVDHAVAAMRRAGADKGLINAGGDLFGFGPRSWTVEVVEPVSRRQAVSVELRDQALATSALIDGSAEHLPPGSKWCSVTVRAPNACDADALTKIVWGGLSNLDALLHQAGATAFGIRADGSVEDVREAAQVDA